MMKGWTVPNMKNNSLGILGKSIEYSGQYNPELLFPVSRADARAKLGISSELLFLGTDTWNCYEISWLDLRGKPHVAVGTFCFPATSKNIVESKSVKLYLNSFNMSKFDSLESVEEIMRKDLGAAVEDKVSVSLTSNFGASSLHAPPGTCIDHLPIKIESYSPDPAFLTTEKEKVTEHLHSNLLRTNCPVTGQPDWATVIIDYTGKRIGQEGLLRYLVSFREETGFHENCIERIFLDIARQCVPDRLSVYGGFTRRGGIDINPFRSSHDRKGNCHRFFRQ